MRTFRAAGGTAISLTLTVAAVVGVSEQPGRSIVTTLELALRRRHILLVLDNCEHVLGAAAELAARLLRAAPRVYLLATSRTPLGIVGETVRRLPPLPVPDSHAVRAWDQLIQVASMQLLLERAVAEAAYVPDPEHARWLVEICRRLDGLPLALELAAARLAVLGPAQLAGGLQDTFRMLVGAPRDAPPRQQTLRATLDWS